MNLGVAIVVVIVNVIFFMFAKSVMQLSTPGANGSKLFKGSFQSSVETELLTIGSQLNLGVAAL